MPRILILKLFFKPLFERICNYVCKNQDMDPEEIRQRIRRVFGTSLSARQIAYLLKLTRVVCEVSDAMEGEE